MLSRHHLCVPHAVMLRCRDGQVREPRQRSMFLQLAQREDGGLRIPAGLAILCWKLMNGPKGEDPPPVHCCSTAYESFGVAAEKQYPL